MILILGFACNVANRESISNVASRSMAVAFKQRPLATTMRLSSASTMNGEPVGGKTGVCELFA